jgi:phosphoserine phosphatase
MLVMKSILTLIAKPLHDGHVQAACKAIDGPVTVDWLGEGEACDVMAADIGLAKVAAALAGEAVDLNIQPASQTRRKRLLIADMDSTIIDVECIDEMGDMLGLKTEIAAITERAMRGELDFSASLRERALMLKGLPRKALQQVYEERISLNPGARVLVMTMHRFGAKTALVSGGFKFFTAQVRSAAGFDFDLGNILNFHDEHLDGTVAEPVVDPASKLATLERLCADAGLAPADAVAIGDGANDLPMIKRAGLGIAFRAKDIVAAAADVQIENGDLTAALYLQGIRQSEFCLD